MKVWSLEQEQEEYDLTVFVSCYNEENLIYQSLETAVKALSEYDFSWELVVIDDFSVDGSVARIAAFQNDHPDIPLRYFVNERNCGLAFNFIEGAYIGKGRYYRMICGDNAEPEEALKAVFKHLGTADLVIPYQVSSGRTLFRRFVSKLFVILVNLASGYRFRYYNGLPIFVRLHVIRWHPLSYGFGFQADLITRLLDEGCSYREIPSFSTENKLNLSTALTFRNFLSVGHTLLEISIRSMRRLLFGPDRHLR